jgi:hypothetical protein
MIASRVCWTSEIVEPQVKDFNRKARQAARRQKMSGEATSVRTQRIFFKILLRETKIHGIFKHLLTKGRSNWRISQLKR